MIALIKKLLREALEMKEAEFDKGGHSIERIKQRIESIPEEDIPFKVKEVVFYNLDKIGATDFSPKRDFAVMLGKFRPDPNSELYVTDDRGRGYYRIWTDEPDAAIKDSTGDEFWMIIRGNVIHTVFLRKSWQTANTKLNADKLRVDAAFKSVDAAIKQFGIKKQAQIRKNKAPIVNINGVKWVVDPNHGVIFKKNKPSVKHKLDNIIDQLPYETQEQILSFL